MPAGNNVKVSLSQLAVVFSRKYPNVLPKSLLSKLHLAWDPKLGQGGQFLIERITSDHATLGPTADVD